MSLTIPDFSKTRVVVAGDVMLDQYWFGAAARISPEAPVPVVRIEGDEGRPGGAANVAVNLAALGVEACMLGFIGADAAGEQLQQGLAAAGVDGRLVTSKIMPTITKLRVLSRNQQLIRLDREEPGADTSISLESELPGALENADVLILSDYAKGALHDVEALIKTARANGVSVLVDPKGVDFSRYRGASFLTPNQGEFEAVAGVCASDAQMVEQARRMIADLDLQGLLITRSERGMLLVEAGEEPVFLSTLAREVFDVTGAGDTVIATLAAALGVGLSPEQAARMANLAAGLVVRKIGVATVSPSELRFALHQRGTGGRGMLDSSMVDSLAEECRARGERLVMTNGCFDILHAGHVGYLEEAKGLGDRLIVAVNDDASVARLKGPDRPVNTLEDRMAVLAGLAAVDWVVAFSEDTPANLIEKICPDVLVKGGDYDVADIVGGDFVVSRGGQVQVLPFRPGRSSTTIINAIRGD